MNINKRELRLRCAVTLGMTEYKLYQLAASCAQGSHRRLARAMVKRAAYHGLPLLPCVTHEHKNGYSALINEKRIEVGSLSYMRAKKIPMQYAMGILGELVSSGYIVRFLSVNGHLAGVLGFSEINNY